MVVSNQETEFIEVLLLSCLPAYIEFIFLVVCRKTSRFYPIALLYYSAFDIDRKMAIPKDTLLVHLSVKPFTKRLCLYSAEFCY